MKESLGFAEGILIGKSRIPQGAKTKVFDWVKCANLIRKHCMIENMFDASKTVEAGLMEDWSCTSGEIFKDGNIVEDDYTYLGSKWATPIIDIDGEEIECWAYSDECEYDAGSKWDEKSISVLNGKMFTE